MTGPQPQEPPDLGPGDVEIDDVEAHVRDLVHHWDHNGDRMDNLLDRVCSSLAAQANHELRQILTMVSTELELAHHRAQTDGARLDPDRLDRMLEVLDRGARIVETLLDRNEVAKLLIHLDRTPTDLASLVGDVLEIEGVHPDREWLDTQLEPVTVPLDREKLARVVGHLVNSLGQARDPESDLVVEVQPTADGAEGFAGLDPCPIPRNRLVDCLQDDLDLEGLEVDLPYARAVVERHGGRLYVDRRSEALGYAFTIPEESPP